MQACLMLKLQQKRQKMSTMLLSILIIGIDHYIFYCHSFSVAEQNISLSYKLNHVQIVNCHVTLTVNCVTFCTFFFFFF